jgi:abortive infection bacteriophage resistance protein
MKKFAKPALTLQKQIELLKRRGLTVHDDKLAAHYLQHISYYRLRAYWLPFEIDAEKDGDHAFAEGTTFAKVVDLYVFDRKLRLLLMDAIERIEVSLRGAWAHHLALKYGSHAYLDRTIFSDQHDHAKALLSVREEIGRSRETFIDHYQSTYNDPVDPPLWMVAEVMSFGALSKWLADLKYHADRQAIAKVYGIDEKVLRSFTHHISQIRNICAHHSRLWNKKFTVTMVIPKFPAALRLAMSDKGDRKLYNAIAMIGYMMRVIAPASDWRKQIVALLNEHRDVDLAQMGFPADWRDRPAWKV